MFRIFILLFITFNAHGMHAIPLTLTQSDSAMQLNLQSPIGVPAISRATVGKVDSKVLQSELLTTAIFVIGADKESVNWLEQHHEQLQKLHAIGFITNVNDMTSLIVLQEKFQLPLLPVNVDPLLDYIHEQHYPLAIAEGAVWQ